MSRRSEIHINAIGKPKIFTIHELWYMVKNIENGMRTLEFQIEIEHKK